jgi:hypothetical protein
MTQKGPRLLVREKPEIPRPMLRKRLVMTRSMKSIKQRSPNLRRAAPKGRAPSLTRRENGLIINPVWK